MKKSKYKRMLSLVLTIVMVLVSMVSINPCNVKAAEMQNGLRGDYYKSSASGTFDFNEYMSTFVDGNINFADLNPVLKERTGRDENCAVRWTGKIQPLYTQDYTFYMIGDNGFRLWINNALVIDNWQDNWDIWKTSLPLRLTAGQKYDFKVEYFENYGGANLKLEWSSESQNRQVIPAGCFYLPDNFNAPCINSINHDNSVLIEGQVSGTIDIVGSCFSPVSSENKVSFLNTEWETYPASLISATQDKITIKVPVDLPAGAYRIKLDTNGMAAISSDSLRVSIELTDEACRPEYPRPDWGRSYKWINLNGQWSFDFDKNSEGENALWYRNHDFKDKIYVPFPWESKLSGIIAPDYLGKAWYERNIELDSSWEGKKIILKFGAVDWYCKLWVNGIYVGDHKGGYTPFEFDITGFVTLNGSNKLTMLVEDNGLSEENYALIGKQGHDAPVGYTHTSGIWQTVSLEGRNSAYIKYAHANPDIDNSRVKLDLNIYNYSDSAYLFNFKYNFRGTKNDIPNGSEFSGSEYVIVMQKGENKIPVTLNIPNQKLWNFDDPNLYEGSLEIWNGNTLVDRVETYFGQREISTENYDGRTYKYITVNGKPVFLSGLLDQGFWKDGIYTAPTDDAYKRDIQEMKNRGFNMIRKHIKIEDPRFYYWADKLGMFIWQDMPWGTGFNTPEGRQNYEYAFRNMIERDYNHPSIIAYILFNETWGINHSTDDEWIKSLYNMSKALDPTRLVEDMSPVGGDHIQPTDLFTWHMYPGDYYGARDNVDGVDVNTYPGSSYMYQPGYQQECEPWLNSEYGGVNCGSGDRDVSWCFKYQTTTQRLHQKLNGFVYTEPYDIEFERNGILNYNRQPKIFGYDEIAYGGDMGINYLTQPDFIGFDNEPVVTLAPGSEFRADLGVIRWSDKQVENPIVKWRFDATDIYGNDISTGIGGSFDINYIPYTLEKKTVQFTVPNSSKFSKLVGTLTAWVEDSQSKVLAKNFTNVIVTDGTKSANIERLADNSYAFRKPADQPDSNTMTNGSGTLEYLYTVPEDMDINALNSMRIIVEASADKPGDGQTSVGEETPSDLTVSVNGHIIDKKLLPDNPRDMRGTLTLSNNAASAGNFGYLLNLNLSGDTLEQIKSELKTNRTISIRYEVMQDAVNRNGLKIYGENSGRYAVNPTVILNPQELYSAESITNAEINLLAGDNSWINYSVEADVVGSSLNLGSITGLVARASGNSGYYAGISKNGSVVTLEKLDGTVIKRVENLNFGLRVHHLKISLFDAHIKVFADDNPVPVIDIYDYSYSSGQAGVKGAAIFRNVTVAPETYGSPDVLFYDDFSTGNTLTNNYTVYDSYGIDGNWNASNGVLNFDATWGQKAVINNVTGSDYIIDGDFTISSGYSGNAGFILRASNFLKEVDGQDGYYAGIGTNNGGFIQLGKMHNNWTELANVPAIIAPDTKHHLKVVLTGPRIRIYLDDSPTPAVDLHDSTYTSGQVGIRGFFTAGTADNIVISPVS